MNRLLEVLTTGFRRTTLTIRRLMQKTTIRKSHITSVSLNTILDTMYLVAKRVRAFAEQVVVRVAGIRPPCPLVSPTRRYRQLQCPRVVRKAALSSSGRSQESGLLFAEPVTDIRSVESCLHCRKGVSDGIRHSERCRSRVPPQDGSSVRFRVTAHHFAMNWTDGAIGS